MEYAIYTFGNGEILKGIFDSIAMLLNSGTGSLFQPALRISLILGAFWMAVTIFYADLSRVFLNWILPSTAILYLLFIPQATLWIHDSVSHTHQKVDHVPYGLASFASYVSKLGSVVTEEVEKVFALPDDLKYHKSGMLFASNLVQQAKGFRVTNENLAENLRQFVGQCVVYDVLLGSKYTIDELRNADDIWGLVSRQASPVRSFYWQSIDHPGTRPTLVTCREGVARLQREWVSVLNKATTLFGYKILGKTPNAKIEILKYLPLSYKYLTDTAKSADQILQQQIMIHAIVDGIEQKSAVLGNAPNFAARRAYLQQRTTYETLGAMAGDSLPAMKAVLEGLAYATFLFVLPLALLPWGYRFLLSWAQVLLWLQLWAPLYAVLNFMMTVAARSKSLAVLSVSNEAGVTIASSVGLVNVNADIAAMAGYLAMSIPFICIALVKGVGSFVHMASHLGNVSQSMAGTAAAEAVTGNYSFGNVTEGVVQISNTSMLSESHAASYRSGSFQMADGRSELLTSADGSQIATIGVSNIPISLNVAETRSAQLSQMAAQSKQRALNLAESTAQQATSSNRQFADFSEYLNKNESLGKTNTMGIATEDARTIQKASQFIEDFSKQHNLTKEQSAAVLGHAGVGTHLGFFNAGASLEAREGSREAKVIEAAEKFVSQNDFQEAMRDARSASQHIAHTTSDETAKRFAEGMVAAYERSDQMRAEASKSFRQSEEYQRQAMYTQAMASSINTNYNQEFVQWLSHQHADNTSGTVGVRGAMHIIANEPQQRTQYAQWFMEEKGLLPGNTVQSDNLQQRYEQETGHQLYSVNNKPLEGLRKKASSLGLGVNQEQAKPIDQVVESSKTLAGRDAVEAQRHQQGTKQRLQEEFREKTTRDLEKVANQSKE